MTNNKGVLLFGGTFDPIHNGHLTISRAVAHRLELEKVIIIPSAQPPHKNISQVSPAPDRLHMIELAIAGNPLFEVSDCELQRSGPSYTLDTVRHFRRIHGPGVHLHWLIGADSIEELNSWYQIEALVEECTIVTAARPDYPTSNLSSTLTRLNPEQVKRIAKYLLDTPLVNISATDIRKRSRQGLSINELVPHAVQQYISQKNLYH